MARFCKQCGTLLGESFTFCPKCGAKYVETIMTKPIVEPTPESIAEKEAKQKELEDQKERVRLFLNRSAFSVMMFLLASVLSVMVFRELKLLVSVSFAPYSFFTGLFSAFVAAMPCVGVWLLIIASRRRGGIQANHFKVFLTYAKINRVLYYIIGGLFGVFLLFQLFATRFTTFLVSAALIAFLVGPVIFFLYSMNQRMELFVRELQIAFEDSGQLTPPKPGSLTNYVIVAAVASLVALLFSGIANTFVMDEGLLINEYLITAANELISVLYGLVLNILLVVFLKMYTNRASTIQY